MLNPSETIHRWLCSPSILPSPHVQAAIDQVDRHESIDQAHWIEHNMADVERVIAAAAQLELKLPARSVRARVRREMGEYLDRVVRPVCFDPDVLRLSERLFTARLGYDIGLHPDGRTMNRYDTKAGLPLLCPDDARAEAKRIAKKYVPAIMQGIERGWHAHYVCLTQPNSEPGKLRDGMTKIFRRFNNTIMRPCKRKDRPFPIRGALAILEAPLNAARAWHPHLNVILLCDDFLDYGRFRGLWHWNVELRKLEGSRDTIEATFRELIKYSTRAVPEKSRAKAETAERRSDRRVQGRASTGRHASLQGHEGLSDLCGASPTVGGGGDGCQPCQPPAGQASPLLGDDNAPGDGAHRSRRPQVAPALTEYAAAEFLEMWRAFRGFRRTRAYGCLYGLKKPPKEDCTRVRWIGRGELVGDHYVERFPLLESIPGDKSTTESLVDRYRRHIQHLRGVPEAETCLRLGSEAMQAWQQIENQPL